MEYKIKDVYEQGDRVVVLVDHRYGEDKLGLGLHTLKLDPETDKPKYLSEVAELLEKKYGVQNRKKKQHKEFIGKTFKLP